MMASIWDPTQVRKEGMCIKKSIPFIRHNQSLSEFRGSKLLHWKDGMKNGLTSSLVENQLIIMMMASMIMNYHPGDAWQAKYVISSIPPATGKFAFFIRIVQKREVKEGGHPRQYKMETGFGPRCN